ncbi:MAG: NFACT RNA binding domain-containing protein [Candidatus Woesearchaeota archaeon]
MVKVVLQIDKSLEENAGRYFENAKKFRQKACRAKEALAQAKSSLLKISEEKIKSISSEKKNQKKREWYEKFRWFFSSEGFLVIGGRDATTNEIIIKKYTSPEDLVFHTDMAGSPFFVVKCSGKKPSQETMQEVADATASYSKAWRLGHSTTPVFWVRPEQVSKSAKSGEYLGKGGFMIYGKSNYIENKMMLAIGLKDGRIIGGPIKAIEKNAEKFVVISQGDKKPSDAAKEIKKILGDGDIDEIIRFLPAGNISVKKRDGANAKSKEK